jgi:hypothetical protein
MLPVASPRLGDGGEVTGVAVCKHLEGQTWSDILILQASSIIVYGAAAWGPRFDKETTAPLSPI